jgi:Xaa-Pro aminopeptidase
VDAASREARAGQEGIFSYGVGHGVGLDIHEEPFMKKTCARRLEPGCVVTVEPGIYLPGEGGIRIEDTAMVWEEGPEVITRSTRELLEL